MPLDHQARTSNFFLQSLARAIRMAPFTLAPAEASASTPGTFVIRNLTGAPSVHRNSLRSPLSFLELEEYVCAR